MPQYLDLDSWPRLDTYKFFRHFDKPYFNICVQLDITNLLATCKATGVSSFIAYHYLTLRAANTVDEFRYRLRDDQVLVHDVVHGGSTLLLPNETIAFVYFDYDPNFQDFATNTSKAIADVRKGNAGFEPRDDHDGLIHFTTLPWISFTSFSHARNWGRDDSVPKIAFGKFYKQLDKTLLPTSVEVHHALMDGIHMGRFINRLEVLLAAPEVVLNP